MARLPQPVAKDWRDDLRDMLWLVTRPKYVVAGITYVAGSGLMVSAPFTSVFSRVMWLHLLGGLVLLWCAVQIGGKGLPPLRRLLPQRSESVGAPWTAADDPDRTVPFQPGTLPYDPWATRPAVPYDPEADIPTIIMQPHETDDSYW